MTIVLVPYYTSYGHIERMSDSMAEGACEGGAEVDVRRVHACARPEAVKAADFRPDTTHPVIESVDTLAEYDAITIGAPSRLGRMPSQMVAFLRAADRLWTAGTLMGQAGGTFTSTAAQHGRQEVP